jgi:hypothetical protein
MKNTWKNRKPSKAKAWIIKVAPDNNPRIDTTLWSWHRIASASRTDDPKAWDPKAWADDPKAWDPKAWADDPKACCFEEYFYRKHSNYCCVHKYPLFFMLNREKSHWPKIIENNSSLLPFLTLQYWRFQQLQYIAILKSVIPKCIFLITLPSYRCLLSTQFFAGDD